MKELFGEFFDSLGIEEDLQTDILDKIEGETIQEKVKSCIFLLLGKSPEVNDEIERKFLEVDTKELFRVLENLGAEKYFEGYIEDNRYDFKDMSLREDGFLVRTRETSQGAYVALKKQEDIGKKNSKDLEFDKLVVDVRRVVNSVSALGLEIVEGKNYRKKRISYKIDYKGKEIHFDFDKYPEIPWLLEIESNSESDIKYWESKLRLFGHIQVSYGYRRLKELYKLRELEKLQKSHRKYKESTII